MKKSIFTFVSFVLIFHGYILAQGQNPAVSAFEDKILQARPLDLTKVRLTGGPLKQAQDVTAKYLLELDPDRMLAGYRIRAGLEAKAEGYGGWDAVESRQLTGHVAGHYLSAISLMYAATGNEEFKKRADYIVSEFKEVQDKRGDGYLGAIINRDGIDGRDLFERLSKGEIRSGGFDLNGLWSPWYTLHKTYAGLRDAYRYTGNKTALAIEIKFAAWAEKILAPLDENQIQRMLNTEFGGMNEIMVDLYADTGDERWLDLSYKFEHRSFIEPLKRHQDELAGKHGNTQVPKLIGSADRFAYTGNAGDIIAATFFWDAVVQHHSFATGGHGRVENFPEADAWSSVVTSSGRTAETCNVYNMLKLTRRLFALAPEAHYADFHERALFNHILGSIKPENGQTCYMVPVGQGVQHEYQNMFNSFTCCVGTGMESHALHGDGIYYESGDKLWVNIYAPSTAEWTAAGVRLEMSTDFPEGRTATLKFTVRSPKEFTLALRKPYWAGNDLVAKVNGTVLTDEELGNVPAAGGGFGQSRGNRRGGQARGDERAGVNRAPQGPSSYIELRRTWKTGDSVELTMPKSLYIEPTPDDPRVAAIMWGPLVLAGDLGPERQRDRGRGGDTRPEEQTIVPVFVAAEQPVAEWLKPVEGEPGKFRTEGVGRDNLGAGREIDAELEPFYRLHNRTYAIYWNLFTQSEWEEKKAEYAAEQERQRRLEEATVAFAQPGEMQAERNYNFQGAEDAQVQRTQGRPGRRASSWFSFDLPVEPDHPMTLIVTYYSGGRRRGAATFEILVDGQRVGQQEVTRSRTPSFFDVEYAIDGNLVRGKEKVTVRFQATNDNQIATVFGLRMIRADMKR